MSLIFVTADASSASAGGDSPAAAPTGAQCGVPDGDVIVDSSGDRHYRFKHAEGWIEEQVVPGASFDPATAPVDRLARLGLPHRPQQAGKRALWDEAARNLKKPRTPKPACVLPGVRADAGYSSNWSGFTARAASGKTYDKVSSAYTAPSYYLSTCTQESLAQWVGVGNGGGTTMVQNGVYVDQFSGTPSSGGFFEFVGGDWETPGLVSVASQVPYVAGHRYFFSAEYVDRYRWAIIVQDLDNGNTYSSNSYHANGGATNYLGTEAYFITERLTHGSVLTQYMSHSDVRFRDATVGIKGESEARMTIQRPLESIMVGNNGERLANNDAPNIANSDFTVHWARCGYVE
ncbi:hypothetical protein Areg01_19920 [Actinoplanes regularis]|nr:hypothetical protein Areg01_19920 [Actinoplanes regularis]